MQNLKPTELMTVVGGATKPNDAITQQLTTLQTSLKDLTSSSSSGGSCGGNNSQMFMMMAMMMAFRPQPTVVAAGGPPAVAAAGPVVNISTRVRHW